ncbi:NADH-quinone oxidoreductase subunit NuoF [Thermococcus nautili]|uniref:NADH:ubiquinone oxidoreductase, NADH-binding (51 kD) subunit n=1 Tax=Thermococcus nautili TaxID=195522 RepID=W8PNM5_9EURY|nr:NADH-quinone oxidoreductase subunit NuoF [Thermococcus nautili]AHL23659.1 NADH:ubiquinone oxidoreductase, NADH-binding (51 kD) subunit [Thermococcus nautili]
MSEIKAIAVGMNSCGIAAGARETYEAIKAELERRNLDVKLKIVGCVGMCYREPLVDIITEDEIITYGHVDPKKVPRIIEEHVVNGKPIEEWIVKRDWWENGERKTWDVDGYFAKQVKIVLENSGYIDPENIDEYIAVGGYEALRKALRMEPEEIIDIIMKSGLRGRGGAGFPTGLKWKFTREAEGDEKYIICNADEGDPGAFMDRNVLEGDPHRVIEGMIIGAYAIGATKGFIYVRAEYPLAIRRLRIALKQAKERGFLGENILGSGFSFDIEIKEGAGAFVCGEETALIASIEGKRGMPRPRPPYPAQKGLFGKPTNINNVETWANVPWIIRHGWKAFASLGTEKSKGTKVFALSGKIKHGGNVEVPMGTTLREILYEIGGGTKTGKRIKAVQLGGPSGGCIPEYLFDTPVDYESVNATGAIMGSGGMVVMDEDTCMVDVAKFFLDFTVKESCGKCTFCRVGTKRMLEILERFTEGKATKEDLERLEKLAHQVKSGSLCGLGQTAPNPVLTTLRYFRDEYLAHIEGKCPAKVCKPLIRYVIIPERCTGCTACAIFCPANAITGEKLKPHEIDQDKCIKCGTCYEVCRFNAIEIVTGGE